MNSRFCYPYRKEKFTKKEKSILKNFFTNIDKPVFAIYNLPQEIVGAMFSRYSRSEKSVRRLFLDEFWDPALSLFKSDPKKLEKARERTRDFYRRVFAEFGDDSVIQTGSVHIAFEFVSQIAAKAIEDQRIGAAYIEKSTRYVNFGNKINGRYLYMDVPEILKTSLCQEYRKWNNFAFESYNQSLLITENFLKKEYPLEKRIFGKIPTEKEQKAYDRALRAKAFDTVRVFLPTTTVTNLGAHFSGQAAENSINKMLSSPYSEVRLLGLLAYQELIKVSPNFLQNINRLHGEIARQYRKNLFLTLRKQTEKFFQKSKIENEEEGVKLVDYDKDADRKIVSQLLFSGQTNTYFSKNSIRNLVNKMSKNKLSQMLSSLIIDRSNAKYNRRHKLPRAFEHAYVEIEFFKDFGIFRDLQRNRISSTERLYLNPDFLEIPPEFSVKDMEEVYQKYLTLHKMTKTLNRKLIKKGLAVSEYVTILGNKLRFNIRANIRQWVFFAELRTIAGGHSSYRKAMQEAVRQILTKMPYFKNLFAKVDWVEDYDLGRLKAEVKIQEKLAKIEQ